jgi:hypothetical protein
MTSYAVITQYFGSSNRSCTPRYGSLSNMSKYRCPSTDFLQDLEDCVKWNSSSCNISWDVGRRPEAGLRPGQMILLTIRSIYKLRMPYWRPIYGETSEYSRRCSCTRSLGDVICRDGSFFERSRRFTDQVCTLRCGDEARGG